MKRPIKFRGQRTDNDEFIYGSYVCGFYHDIGTLHTIIDEGGEEFPVNEDSIAQLVGYDKDGREVYEGDVLVLNYGDKRYEYTARLQPCARNSDGLIHYSFEILSLKEAPNAD